MKALVALDSSVPALSIGVLELAALQQALPQIELVHCATSEQLLDLLPMAGLVISWQFESDWYGRAPILKAVLTPAAGRDWARDDPTGKVPVFRGSFHGKLMRESLLAMMLYFNTHAAGFLQAQRLKRWDRSIGAGRNLLATQTVLFIGYGAIARYCAQVLAPLGCRLLGTTRSLNVARDVQNSVDLVPFTDLERVVALADHVVVLLPGGEQTRGIVSRAVLETLKPGACIYNLGRGSAIDESALVEMLRSKKIAGAGLDVFSTEPLEPQSPLWELDNVIITPHTSACYCQYGELFAREAADWLLLQRTNPQFFELT